MFLNLFDLFLTFLKVDIRGLGEMHKYGYLSNVKSNFNKAKFLHKIVTLRNHFKLAKNIEIIKGFNFNNMMLIKNKLEVPMMKSTKFLDGCTYL